MKKVILIEKYSQNHFLGVICVQMTILTNLTTILKRGSHHWKERCWKC